MKGRECLLVDDVRDVLFNMVSHALRSQNEARNKGDNRYIDYYEDRLSTLVDVSYAMGIKMTIESDNSGDYIRFV